MNKDDIDLQAAVTNPELRVFMIQNLQARAETQATITVAIGAAFMIGVGLTVLAFLLGLSNLIMFPLMLMALSTQPLREAYAYWQTLKTAKWALEDYTEVENILQS